MNRNLTQQIANAARSSASAGDSARVVAELGAVARIVLRSPRLAKALASPELNAEAKRALLEDLTKSSFSSVTISVAVTVAGEPRLSGSAVASLLLESLVAFVFYAAGDDLSNIETQLYEFGRVIEKSPGLRDALSNPGVTDEVKDSLVADLLGGKVDPAVIELARSLVYIDHGRDIDGGLDLLSRSAARMRNSTVADVRTAIELDDRHKQALAQALSETTGKQVQPRFTVDPSILGSVIVRIGDEVLDGSVRHRLDQARQALLGAS